MTNKIFGIDLGTTYSCIAYVDEFGKAVTIRNADGDMTTPSVVYFEDNEKQVVGTEAKASMVMEPQNTVAFIKREMGTDYRRDLHGVSYSPQEISAKILMKVVNDANAALKEQGVLAQDENINKAVITCPAYFGMAEKEATKSAGVIAGLDVLDIINEPTAAAINYGSINAGDNKTVMVYDLGGGTFDVTIMTINGNDINVICTGGDPQLGGKDWDNTLKDWLVEKWKEEQGTDEDISEDLETLSSLMEQAEKAKKTLTAKETAKIGITYEGERMKLEISRDEYDALTKRLLDRTIELTDSCLKEAEKKGVTLDKLDEILLVGGSSRMPQVKKRVEEVYHKPTSLHDPDEAVAKGAALYAQNLNGYKIVIDEIAKKTGKSEEQIKQEVDNGGDLQSIAKKAGLSVATVSELNVGQLRISNVSSRTYGIRMIDAQERHYIHNMIMQNDNLPNSVTLHDVHPHRGGSGVVFAVYESLSDQQELYDESLATEITSFELNTDVPMTTNTELVVSMTFDNAGLLTVDAEEMDHHTKLHASFNVKNSLNDKELRIAMARSKNSTVE